MFATTINSEGHLREVYRAPSDLVQHKVLDRFDHHAREFIALAPFVLVGTASPDGTADVSPKGGPAGFVVVLDDQHLAIPDLSGNNLLDSITNVVNGSGVGLLFMVPGIEETLRVNGHACVTIDSEVLDACAVKDRRPKAAIGVTVTQQYMHCAKAFRRSELWHAESWPAADAFVSLGCVIKDQIPTLHDVDASVIDGILEDDYAATLWEPGGSAADG